MEKLRIFQFPIRSSNGGITHYAMNNWRRLDKTKFTCDFGTVSKQIYFADEIAAIGAGLRYISCYAEEDRERFICEVSDILRGNYDIVHLHTNWWKSFLVEEIALECGIPKIIVHSHNTYIDSLDDDARLAAEKLHEQKKAEFNTSLATDFCACSVAAADWLFGPQIPRERIMILKNAIEVERFLYNKAIRDDYRRRLGIDDCFVIGHVGRFSYQKNHDFLLSVFARVFGKLKNARLMLIGSGPLEKDIKNKADALGISDKVMLLGSRGDVPQLLQAMDVFCLPSRFEGLPIVLIEAQSAGLKCLVSDAVTVEAKLTDGVRFLSCTEERWAQAILDAAKGYQRKSMYEEITAAGYNISHQIKQVEQMYLA